MEKVAFLRSSFLCGSREWYGFDSFGLPRRSGCGSKFCRWGAGAFLGGGTRYVLLSGRTTSWTGHDEGFAR